MVEGLETETFMKDLVQYWSDLRESATVDLYGYQRQVEQ